MVFPTFLNLRAGGPLELIDSVAELLVALLVGLPGLFLLFGTFLFQGCGKINQNLVVVGTLLVPLAVRLVFCVQVNHIRDEVTDVECGRILHPLAALAPDV